MIAEKVPFAAVLLAMYLVVVRLSAVSRLFVEPEPRVHTSPVAFLLIVSREATSS